MSFFQVFDPSPLTVCINCSFYIYICCLLPVLSRLLIMFINTFFDFSRWRPSAMKIFKSSKYQLLVWRAIHYMCVRTQKFLSYASSAIFHTCYSLSVRKNCLTYAQKMYNICLRAAYWTTVDNSRIYKNYILTDETVLRHPATFKLSFRTIFLRNKSNRFMFTFTLIDMWTSVLRMRNES